MSSSADILKAGILIVDDQAANVRLLEQMLRGAGYTSVTSTMHPQEVLELHRQNRYSLILLDLHMPGMSGLELLGMLSSRNISTPVIVVSGRGDEFLDEMTKRAGAMAMLHKPVDDEIVDPGLDFSPQEGDPAEPVHKEAVDHVGVKPGYGVGGFGRW